jgi:hypothetical protein
MTFRVEEAPAEDATVKSDPHNKARKLLGQISHIVTNKNKK